MPTTTTTSSAPAGRAPLAQSALAGLVAGGVTVGVAELLAALLSLFGLGGQASPVIAVGGAFVDRTPGALKDFAIRTFGEHDKQVLLGSIGLVLVVLAVVAGVLAARRLVVGLGVVVLLGLVAVVAVATRPGAGPLDVLPTLVGTVLGVLALRALLTRPVQGQDTAWSRRTFLRGAGAAGAVAVVAGGGSRAITALAGGVEQSREDVALPAAVERVQIPADVDLPVKGITPWRTDPAKFYRVDTALSLPQISTDEWTLEITGMVGKPLTITYDELLAKPLVERAITLTCVSNEVGGKLAGNAVWLGYPVSELLKDLQVAGDADMVLSTSEDGMTISTPLQNLTQGTDAILAVAMNGQPLPVQHGFPVRMVVPGLYGYVSATKWIRKMKVTRFDRDEAYWTPRGYAAKAPIKISSRIDVPTSFAQLKAGKNAVAGVAWAQTRGVSKVEVRVDKGEWVRARLAGAPNEDTWVQWVYEWDAEPGNHTIECRVIDGEGREQVEQRAKIRPDGTTGLDSKNVTVA
ncbi:molybdopterin-dependent oxidoreductase [Angustibacter aerolatus]